MFEEINLLFHNSIRYKKDLTIYFDPFKINENYNDADIIFITHSHYDHYSKEDILKVKKEETIIVIPEDLINEVETYFSKENIISVVPNKKYMVKNISFETVPAYNINKNYHPKTNNWVGYLVTICDIKYYIAGDTDVTEENKKIKCDVVFIPIGGTYTMDYKEAAMLINEIKPRLVVPTHFGTIVGTKEDGVKFLELLDKSISYRV